MADSTDVYSQMLYAKANATGFVDDARTALDAANRALTSLKTPPIDWTAISPSNPPRLDLLPDTPSLDVPTLDIPAVPDAPTGLEDIGALDIGQTPEFRAEAPTINLPNTPSPIGAGPAAPIIATDFEFPESPNFLIPEAPVAQDHGVPVAPVVSFPVFEAQLPEQIGEAPDATTEMLAAYGDNMQYVRANVEGIARAWVEAEHPGHYQRILTLNDKLNDLLQSRSTGMPTEIETAIQSKYQSDNDRSAERLRQTAYAEAASRGFTLPSGALMGAVARARTEAHIANVKGATDLAVSKLDMEQRNLQFAVTTAQGLYQAVTSAAAAYVGSVLSMNAQALDFSKTMASSIIEVYNASVSVFQAKMDAYKTQASVFETRIKEASEKVSVYRAEIAALEALTNVDQSKVATYRAQIDAAQSVIGIYQANIDAVKSRASLEKLKIELFQAQAQAYGSQVQAKNAEWSAYTAQIGGEEAKAKVYSTQVGAFNAQVDAYRTTIQAKVSQIDAVSRSNQAKSELFNTAMRGYSAQVDAESARSRAHNDNNRAVLTEYQRLLAVTEAQTRLDLAVYGAESEVKIKNAVGDFEAKVKGAEFELGKAEAIARTASDGSRIYGTLAGSAMAGISTLSAAIENG